MRDMKYIQMTLDMTESDDALNSLGGVVSIRIYRYLKRLKSLKER